MNDTTTTSGPASDRVRLRRGAGRGDYDPTTIRSILDAGLIAHVGVVTDDGPVVVPMAYGHDGTDLFLHGARANAAFAAAIGSEVCVTVTIVDGLILARAPFHNSMRYRSVVVRGRGAEVTDEAARLQALRLVNDRVVETWDTGRAPNPTELRRTLVVSVPLAEASAKVRAGDPADEPDDLDSDHWAGAVPLVQRWGSLEPSADLRDGIAPPSAVDALVGRNPSDGPTSRPVR